MNYKRIYNELIKKRRVNPPAGYIERHHILPKALGGKDIPGNLVDLTAREHYIAHLLLAKFNPCSSTITAVLIMSCKNSNNTERHYIRNSHMYEWARKEFSKYMKVAQKGESNSQYGTMWINKIGTFQNMKILKDDIIPEGWVKGRKFDSDENRKANDLIMRRAKSDQEKRDNKKHWEQIYNNYIESGYRSLTQYSKSIGISNQLLSYHFRKNIDNYTENSKQGFMIKNLKSQRAVGKPESLQNFC